MPQHLPERRPPSRRDSLRPVRLFVATALAAPLFALCLLCMVGLALSAVLVTILMHWTEPTDDR